MASKVIVTANLSNCQVVVEVSSANSAEANMTEAMKALELAKEKVSKDLPKPKISV